MFHRSQSCLASGSDQIILRQPLTLVKLCTYNAANQVSGWTYDNAGNLTSDGATTYTYDTLNRMTRRNGTAFSYAYNGDGALIKQTAGGIDTLYTQDLVSPLTQILQTKVGSATATDYLVYYQGDKGSILAGVSGGTRTWYLHDGLGSVRGTVSDAGTPLGIINYDPWGTPENGIVPTFGFTGELQEVAAGLVNLRTRWYSTAQGRFTARDTFAGLMTAPQTLAPYPYAENDPVNRIDPSGNLAIFVAGRGSEDRGKDPLGNQAALISVWEMGARFAHEIPGETIIASWNAYQNIVQKVKTVATDTCHHEPVILVGHSLGADTIMQVAYELSDVHIDLLVTIDLANVSSDYRASRTPSNVGRHINFISDNAPRNLLTKLIIDVPDYVDGAENYRIAGSVHTNLDNEFLDDAHKYPNPVWSMTEQAILKLR